MLENSRTFLQRTASAMGWLVASDRATSTPLPLAHTIEAIAQTAIEGGYSACIGVGVALPIKSPVTGTFGIADLASGAPATGESLFQAGACTDQFIAAAILLLAERNALRLDDPIAGAPSPDGSPEARTLRALMIGDAADYRLLRRVIERVTGGSWGAFVTEQLLLPAGMTGTRIAGLGEGERSALPGYRLVDEQAHAFSLVVSGEGDPEADRLYTNAGDLLLWNRALHSGWLLTHASLDVMTNAGAEAAPCPVLAPFASRQARGMGVAVGRLFGRRAFWRCGQAPGHDVWLFHFPDDRTDLALLSNTEQGAATILEPMLRAVLRL